MPDDRMQIFHDGTIVQRNKIPDYAFEGFGECIETWQIWEIKNLLPFPGTWREQPAHVWDMLRIFDAVHASHAKAESEIAQLERKAKAGKH